MKPGMPDKFQRALRFRAAVDKIANRKQPVTCRIESELLQHRFQQRETTMDITDDKITSGGVP
jgi:hypothetical protein